STMGHFAALTGRTYKLFEYEGPADAERVIVLMGSGAETARETAAFLRKAGAPGEPLYVDVVTTLAQAVGAGKRRAMPRVIGGRYGLGSKNFNPAQTK